MCGVCCCCRAWLCVCVMMFGLCVIGWCFVSMMVWCVKLCCDIVYSRLVSFVCIVGVCSL